MKKIEQIIFFLYVWLDEMIGGDCGGQLVIDKKKPVIVGNTLLEIGWHVLEKYKQYGLFLGLEQKKAEEQWPFSIFRLIKSDVIWYKDKICTETCKSMFSVKWNTKNQKSKIRRLQTIDYVW